MFFPIVLFTTSTNPDEIQYLKDARVVLDPFTDVIQVSKCDLKVRRFWNKITVSLTTQEITLFYVIPQEIPAFCFTITKCGRLMHEKLSSAASPWADAYTYNRFNLYYEANGAITFPGLSGPLSLSDAQFNAYEFRTYVPPTPP